MSNIRTFNFENSAVRTIVLNGKAWFVASDVATLLGYVRPADAVRSHCKGVGETATPSPGGVQTVKIIQWNDVFRLVMRSKLPSAERFQDWVHDEVLPAIQKTGSYSLMEVQWRDAKAGSTHQRLKAARAEAAELRLKLSFVERAAGKLQAIHDMELDLARDIEAPREWPDNFGDDSPRRSPEVKPEISEGELK